MKHLTEVLLLLAW